MNQDFNASRDLARAAGDATQRHTPGPWYVNGCELVGDSTILATLCWHSGRERENLADYALIAAAPEMLEALTALKAWLADVPLGTHGAALMMRDVIATIAKAQGNLVASPDEGDRSRDDDK